VCLVPGSHVLALDAEGRLRWSFDAGGAGVGPRWYCDREHTVVQAGGSITFLDSADGRVLQESPGEVGPWLRDPVRLEAGGFAIVEASRRIRAIPAESDGTGWTYSGGASHANADPDLRAAGDRLLAVIDGDTLVSLDPRSGQRQWSRPLLRTPLPAAGGLLATDPEHLYSAAGGILRRINLADGSLAAERFVGPDARRQQAVRFDEYVAVMPAGPAHDPADPPSQEALVLCEAESGAPVQELLFRVGAPGTTAGLQVHVDWPTCILVGSDTIEGLGRR
jgi:hypothetical protein